MNKFNLGDILIADHKSNSDKYLDGYPVNGRLYEIIKVRHYTNFDLEDVENGTFIIGYYYDRFRLLDDELKKYNL